MKRGDVTDKHYRVCKSCGNRVHVNWIRGPGTYNCNECGGEYFTRDKTKVDA